jgi:hypothetical protein
MALYKKKNGGSGQVTLQSPKTKDKYSPSVNTVNSDQNGGFYFNTPYHTPIKTNQSPPSNPVATQPGTEIATEVTNKTNQQPVSTSFLSGFYPEPPIIKFENPPKPLYVKEDFVSQVDYLVYLLKAFRINPSPQLYSFIEIGIKNIGPEKK